MPSEARLEANAFFVKIFLADEAKMILLQLRIDAERSEARSQRYFVKIFVADEAKNDIIS